MTMNQQSPNTKQPVTSLTSVITRLIWIFFGPLVLMLLLMSMALKGRGWFTGLDLIYFVVLASMIVARWKEQTSGSAKTVYGDPATLDHFRRYVLIAVPLAITSWALANVLGNHVWKGA